MNLRASFMFCAFFFGAAAAAQVTDVDNACLGFGGAGSACVVDADCAFNSEATVCVQHIASNPASRSCEAPCDENNETACALGEVCAAAPASTQRFCEPTRFRMDLNLLDQCIAHFRAGTSPVLGNDNPCAVDAQLSRLLDQDSDGDFDIEDVDGCIQAFLLQPACDPALEACPDDDLRFCRVDDDCAVGAYCDGDRFACARDCGALASREVGIANLVRQCSSAGTVCNEARGRCDDVDIASVTCAVDRDCPTGAYCFLGTCAETCSRQIDCPDDDWTCGGDGKCRVRPAADDVTAGFSFNPQDYAVLFSTTDVTVTPLENQVEVPLLIIDLTTKREVRDNPAVGFGYRLQIDYAVKQEAICFADPSTWTPEQTDDCLISADDEFLTALEPFSTVFAVGTPGVPVLLNSAAADRLTPGAYKATVTATFDNGSRARFNVNFIKSTPSGEYVGSYNVSMAGQRLNAVNELPLSFAIDVKEGVTLRWTDLLAQERLNQSEDLVDTTEGFFVEGFMHANDMIPFANPAAQSPGDNEIPIKGLFVPATSQLRLITQIDLPGDFCLGENGACEDGDDGLTVTNPFGRDVRRVVQFTGVIDQVRKNFIGVYRERISGLVALSDLTLDGAFITRQIKSDETPIVIDAPLGTGGPDIKFPLVDVQLGVLDQEIADHCVDDDGAPVALVSFFENQAKFESYLQGAGTTPRASEEPVFQNLVQFRSLLQDALDNLQNDDQRVDDAVTLYDFFAGRIGLCVDDAGSGAGTPIGSSAPACIEESVLRCGLALHQRALLKHFVEMTNLQDAAPGELQLFCTQTLPTEGCDTDSVTAPELFTLQEHNRFFSELAESRKFLADISLSDSFFALYRNRVNPFAQGAALAFKADKLKQASALYDDASGAFFDTPTAAVLFAWPMDRFQGQGAEWLRLASVIENDRLEVLAQEVDLRRRVFRSSTEANQMVAEGIAQNEYLSQVYLMALERQWEGNDFVYSLDADAAFTKAQKILLQLNSSRNPLGIVPDQVFFTNSDPSKENWEHYLSVLQGDDGSGGLLAQAHTEIDDAVINLQASLRDVDALEDQVFALNDDFEGTLTELCGTDDENIACNELIDRFQNAPQELAADARKICSSKVSAPFGLGNKGLVRFPDECNAMVESFVGSSGFECTLDAAFASVSVRGEDRACVGGTMGGLLTERAALAEERVVIAKQLAGAVDSLRGFYELRSFTEGIHAGERLNTLAANAVSLLASAVSTLIGLTAGSAEEAAETANCVIIAGTAAGSDCPQKGAAQGAISSLKFLGGIGQFAVESLGTVLGQTFDVISTEFGFALEREDANAEFQSLKGGADGLVDALRANLLASQAVERQIQETRAQADDAAAGVNDRLSLLFDHLVGRENGSVLVGSHLVRQSDKTFRRTLDVTYRMIQAFALRYNLSVDAKQRLEEKVFAAVTIEDVDSIIDEIIETDTNYCGIEGIDCDAFNNLNVTRVSLRKLLFPQLRDLIDPRTGVVITAGEQFNNIITAPPFLRRRVRGVLAQDQIEIPFTIPLAKQGDASSASFLLSPTQCNQILDGDPDGGNDGAGTLAVNVIGRNLDDPTQSIQYEVSRGSVDFVRACHPEVVQNTGELPRLDYPVRAHVIGYAPESLEAQRADVPSFFTRSGELSACVNAAERRGIVDEDDCWRFFARDRSVAASDWTLTIPLSIDGAETGNAWLLGDGLPAARRPVIDDVVVYLRHRSRPISEP